MYQFDSYETAMCALKIARRIVPDYCSYITNEHGGVWSVVIREFK